MAGGLVIASLLLTHCQRQTSNLPETAGARTDVFLTQQLFEGGLIGTAIPKPGAILGTYVAGYLSTLPSFPFHSALSGIMAQMEFVLEDETDQSESFILLEELGITLQANVPDLLNRSPNRPRALDAYLDALQDILEESTAHVAGLEIELEELNDERSEQRGIVGDLQRELREALRSGDYTTAGAKQADVISAQTELAQTEAQQDEKRDIIRIFEDLLEIGTERLEAMQANRDILIAGLSVVELPGVDDLGLIMEQTRRRRSGDSGGLFGPTGN